MENEDVAETPTPTSERPKTILHRIRDSIYPFYKLLFINLKFRWIFLSSFVSTIGNYFSEVAILSLVEAHSGRNGGFGLMGIYFCIMSPPILLMLITGIVADRFDKRKVMFISDITRSVLVFCLFLFGMIWDLKQYFWMTYIVLFMMICAGSFFDPAREGFTPFIVEKQELINATTLDGMTWMTCTVIGASLGGLVTGTLGARANFLIDSITFLISAMFVIQLMRFPELSPISLKEQIEKEAKEESAEVMAESDPVLNESVEKNDENVPEEVLETDQQRLTDTVEAIVSPDDQDTLDAEIKEPTPEIPLAEVEPFLITLKKEIVGLFFGIRYLFQNPYLLSLVCIKGTFTYFFVNLEFLILKFGDTQFRIGEDSAILYGIAKGLIGVSAALGPVLLVIFFDMTGKRMRIFIFINTIIQIGGFLILWWSPNVWVFLLGTTIVGGSCGIPWGFSTAMIQQNCPKEILGRVMAVDYGFLMNFTNIMATLLCGICLDVFNFTPNQLALLGVGVGVFCFFYYGTWLFLTRHKD